MVLTNEETRGEAIWALVAEPDAGPMVARFGAGRGPQTCPECGESRSGVCFPILHDLTFGPVCRTCLHDPNSDRHGQAERRVKPPKWATDISGKPLVSFRELERLTVVGLLLNLTTADINAMALDIHALRSMGVTVWV